MMAINAKLSNYKAALRIFFPTSMVFLKILNLNSRSAASVQHVLFIELLAALIIC